MLSLNTTKFITQQALSQPLTYSPSVLISAIYKCCHGPSEALGALVVYTPAQRIYGLLTSCPTSCGLLELGRRGTTLHGSLRNVQNLDMTIFWSVPWHGRTCVRWSGVQAVFQKSVAWIPLTPNMSVSNCSQFQVSSFADRRGLERLLSHPLLEDEHPTAEQAWTWYHCEVPCDRKINHDKERRQ